MAGIPSNETIVELGYALYAYATNFRNITMVEIVKTLADELPANGTVEDVAIILGATVTQLQPIADQIYAIVGNVPLKIVAIEVGSILSTFPTGAMYLQQYNSGLYVLAIAPVISVGLRLLSRKMLRSKIRMEDWSIVVSLVLLMIINVIIIYTWLSDKGIRHIWDISFHDYMLTLEVVYFVGLLYLPCLFFVKLSFLKFYYDLSLYISRARLYRACVIMVGSFILIYTITCDFVFTFLCKPVNFWDHFVEAKCVDKMSLYWAHSVLNISTDLLVFVLLPMPIAWNLHLRPKEKFQLVGFFGLNIFVCIASIFRMTTLNKFANSFDQSYDDAPTGYWTMVELNLAVICTSIPAIRSLLPQFLPRFFSKDFGVPSEITSPMHTFDDLDTEGLGTRSASANDTNGPYYSNRRPARAFVLSNTTTSMQSHDDRLSSRDDLEGLDDFVGSGLSPRSISKMDTEKDRTSVNEAKMTFYNS